MMVALALASGCSKFKSSRGLDMGPFAENTTTMLAEAQRVVQPLDWNYLREYRQMGVTDSVMREVELIRRVFRGIGFYSIQVVALNNAKISNKERAAKLAKYIEETTDPIIRSGEIASLGLTAAGLDSMVQNAKAQTTYLGALSAINPLVYSVASFCIERVDHVAAISQHSLVEIQSVVDRDFADIKKALEDLDACEDVYVRDYLMLQDYRSGKTESLEPLLARDLSLRELLGDKAKPSGEATEKAQKVLQERLASVDAVRKQLDARKELHALRVAEVDDFRNEIAERNRTARLMLIYWMRSHSNLAQGITIPPAINMGEIVGSSAKKALKTLP
jgi:hypothetical protein